MHDKLLKAEWKYYDDPEGKTHMYSDGFYQKRMYTALINGTEPTDIYANLVRYPEMPEHNVPVSYELTIYLTDEYNFAGEPMITKVYTFPEHRLNIKNIEKYAKEIIRRLRKP